jgi:histidine triad (HIT) family protein
MCVSASFAVACVFCSIASGETPASFMLREETVCAFLDTRPVFKGHVLVIPRRHVATFDELREIEPLFSAVQRVSAAVEAGLGADGTFVALNNKISQSVPHVHVHVVPRRKGDGLRGFFWPRQRYADDAEAAAYAQRIRDALAAGG